jgi:hypothetical protein
MNTRSVTRRTETPTPPTREPTPQETLEAMEQTEDLAGATPAVQALLDEIAQVNQETKALQVANRIRELENQLYEAREHKKRIELQEVEGTRVRPGDTLEPAQETLASSQGLLGVRQTIEREGAESLTIRGARAEAAIPYEAAYKRQHADKPKPYKGRDIREYEEFIIACGKEYDNFPVHFRDPYERIRYAVNHLAAGPSHTWEEEEDINNHSWDTFKTFLLDQIDDETNRQLRANFEYEQAKMSDTQAIQDFVRLLEGLELQLEPKTVRQKRDTLLAKLPIRVRQIVTARADSSLPATRKELVAMVKRIQAADDNYLQARGKGRDDRGKGKEREETGPTEKRGRGSYSPPAQDRAKSQRRDYMQSYRAPDRTPASGVNRAPVVNSGGGTQATCRGCGASDHVYRQCPNIKCFACGKSGHISPACPNSGNGKAQV